MNKVVQKLQQAIGGILLDKEHQVNLALACMFSRGHLLIEDLPGMGKTTLAHCLSRVMGLSYDRVQFTSDLLPSDILGVSVFEQSTNSFTFHPGPIFSQVLLADEINRATPKTQSALLEAMEEKQVSVEGETRPLPHPFFVIATQNPLSQIGTYSLPESQLDRFLVCISLGYPSKEAERKLYKGLNPRENLETLQAVISPEQLLKIQSMIKKVNVSDHLLDYLQRLVDFTRNDGHYEYGLSPRGALALLTCAKAWAFIAGRDYATPEDIQAVLEPVAGHRLRAANNATNTDKTLVIYLLENVEVLQSK